MRRWLQPLAGIWEAVARARVAAYQRGLLPRHRLPRPTVSIGALEMGGTGKSPSVAALALMLRDAGIRPGILSRGYGRDSRGPLLVSDGAALRARAREAGDEPYLYTLLLPDVPVAVAARREAAARLLLTAADVDVLLLDDALQHVRVHRDADLLVVDSAAPFWDGAPPPAGRLREGAGAARRADAFLVTGENTAACVEELARRFPGRPAFALRVEEPGATPLSALQRVEPTVPPQPVLPFAGIARPQRFQRSLRAAGVEALEPIIFADHHWYQPAEIRALREQARRQGAQALLTTEKDAVRLAADEEDAPAGPPIWVWRYRLQPSSPADLLRFLQPRLGVPRPREQR